MPSSGSGARVLVLDRDVAVVSGGRRTRAAAAPSGRCRGPSPTAREVPGGGSGSTGKRWSITPLRRTRSGWTSVSLPCAKPMRSPTLLDDAQRVDPLPPEVAGVEVHAHVRPGVLGQARERRGRRPSARRAARGRCAPPGAPSAPRRAQLAPERRQPRARTATPRAPRRRARAPRARRPASARRRGRPGIRSSSRRGRRPSAWASSIAPWTSARVPGAESAGGCRGLPAAFTHESCEAMLAQLARQPVAGGRLAQERSPGRAGGRPAPSRPLPSRCGRSRAPRTRRTPARANPSRGRR